MHEMAPAPGDRLMSQEATKNASQVSSVTLVRQYLTLQP
mgnify:CR=1 FL=1